MKIITSSLVGGPTGIGVFLKERVCVEVLVRPPWTMEGAAVVIRQELGRRWNQQHGEPIPRPIRSSILHGQPTELRS